MNRKVTDPKAETAPPADDIDDKEFFDYTNMKVALPDLRNVKIVLNVESTNLADLVFIVGEEQERIMSHRKLLSLVNSEVFKRICCGCEADKHKDIVLPDVNPEAFREFLRYIFTQAVNLTHDNMLNIYKVAKSFEVEALIKECRVFICDNINHDNLLDVFEFNKLYEDDVINEKCKEIILDYPVEFFTLDKFKNVIDEFLKLLYKSNELQLSELDLFMLTLKWVGAAIAGEREKFLLYLLRNVPKSNQNGKTPGKEITLNGPIKSTFYGVDISSLCFDVKKKIYLYKIGFYVGSPSHHGQIGDLWIELYEELKDDCDNIPNKLIYKQHTTINYTKYVSIKFFQFDNVLLEKDKTYILQINYRFDKFYKLHKQPQNVERFYMVKDCVKMDKASECENILDLVLMNNKFTYNTTFQSIFYGEAK